MGLGGKMKQTEYDLESIIRGTDWAVVMTGWNIDGVAQDLSLYHFDCQMKTKAGVEQLVKISPKITLTNAGLQLSLTEVETAALPTGTLYYNLLATRGEITQQVIGGKVLVLPGVTSVI